MPRPDCTKGQIPSESFLGYAQILPIHCIIPFSVYYRQTEVNVQEEVLEKIDEAMDDKAAKLEGSLADVLTLARKYYSNELLYRYLLCSILF